MIFIAGSQAYGAAIERRHEMPEQSICHRRFSRGRKRCLGIDFQFSREDSGRINSNSGNGLGVF